MTLENIPWAVGGGIVSPSLARMLAYQATSGAEGICGLGDFLVTQTAVASSNVQVANGGAVILNRYPGVKNESYMVRAGDSTNVAIPTNASGATRYDLLVVRIDDWNFAGQQATPATLPTNTVPVAKFQVISNVAASTKTAAQLNLNYPAVALARIAIPASTSAVTKAMITDLREMAVPRRKRDLRVQAQGVGRNNSLATTTATGEQFPNDGVFTVEVPEWASQVKVTSTLGGLYAPAGSVYAGLWIRLGHGRADVINTEATLVDFTSPRADPSRFTSFVGQTYAIPKTMRGQSITVLLIGRKLGGTQNLVADNATVIALDMEFVEAPSEDV